MEKVRIPSMVIKDGKLCTVIIYPLRGLCGTDSPFIPEVEEN